MLPSLLCAFSPALGIQSPATSCPTDQAISAVPATTASGLCLSGTRRGREEAGLTSGRLPVPRLVTAAAANGACSPHGAVSWHGLARPVPIREEGWEGLRRETEGACVWTIHWAQELCEGR